MLCILQRQHDNTLRELKALQQSRAELEQHVDALVLEREMMKKQLSAARQARPEEIKVNGSVFGQRTLLPVPGAGQIANSIWLRPSLFN